MNRWASRRACILCGVDISHRRSDAIFCSRECRNKERTTRVERPEGPPDGMKLCPRCEETKPLADFVGRSDGPGLRAHCRVCLSAASTDWGKRHRERVRDLARLRYRADSERIKARSADYKRRNREKARAHSAVEYALGTGVLVRPDICEDCGESPPRIHAHHDDYSRKLDVRWLCPSCHVELHLEKAAA